MKKSASDDSWQVVDEQLADPLQTAVLWNSKKRGGCGHCVPLDRFVARRLPSCPVCDRAVSYVEDAAAAAADEQSSSTVVCFKYGKLVYRLSVPALHDDDDGGGGEQQGAITTATNRPWWMFWGDNSSSNTDENGGSGTQQSTSTAQGRIMSVLGISSGMKVRCCYSHTVLPSRLLVILP